MLEPMAAPSIAPSGPPRVHPSVPPISVPQKPMDYTGYCFAPVGAPCRVVTRES